MQENALLESLGTEWLMFQLHEPFLKIIEKDYFATACDIKIFKTTNKYKMYSIYRWCIITSARCLFRSVDIQCSASIRVASHSLDNWLNVEKINNKCKVIFLTLIAYYEPYDYLKQGTLVSNSYFAIQKCYVKKKITSNILKPIFSLFLITIYETTPSCNGEYCFNIKSFSRISLYCTKFFIGFTSNL